VIAAGDDARAQQRRRGRAIVAALLGDAESTEKQADPSDRETRARRLAREVLWLRKRVAEARLG
jgi:hypothetical protein